MDEKEVKRIKDTAWDHIASGEYREALSLVNKPIHENQSHPPELVAIFGCCRAIVEKKRKEGLELCRKAIEASPNNPNLHFLLGVTLISVKLRSQAFDAFQEGLNLDNNHPLIIKAIKELGDRQKLAVPFLSRSNPINVALGKRRHAKKLKEKQY